MNEKKEWAEPAMEVLSEEEVLGKWDVDLMGRTDKVQVVNPTILW